MVPRRQACAWILLFALSGAAVPATLVDEHEEVLGGGGDHAPAAHSCPDRSASGDPCPEGCPCVCCPGHRYGVFSPSLLVLARVPLARTALRCMVDELTPQDFAPRIFRPPPHA